MTVLWHLETLRPFIVACSGRHSPAGSLGQMAQAVAIYKLYSLDPTWYCVTIFSNGLGGCDMLTGLQPTVTL